MDKLTARLAESYGAVVLIANYQNYRSLRVFAADRLRKADRFRCTTVTILTNQQIMQIPSASCHGLDNVKHSKYYRHVSWRVDAARLSPQTKHNHTEHTG